MQAKFETSLTSLHASNLYVKLEKIGQTVRMSKSLQSQGFFDYNWKVLLCAQLQVLQKYDIWNKSSTVCVDNENKTKQRGKQRSIFQQRFRGWGKVYLFVFSC